MKTVQYYLLSFGVLFLLAGQAVAVEQPVLGQGNISCSAWIERRQSDNASPSRTAWVLGFLTGFNQYGSKSQADDVSEGKSTEELMRWIDDYCRRHPGDNLHRASAAFIDAFRQRTGR